MHFLRGSILTLLNVNDRFVFRAFHNIVDGAGLSRLTIHFFRDKTRYEIKRQWNPVDCAQYPIPIQVVNFFKIFFRPSKYIFSAEIGWYISFDGAMMCSMIFPFYKKRKGNLCQESMMETWNLSLTLHLICIVSITDFVIAISSIIVLISNK